MYISRGPGGANFSRLPGKSQFPENEKFLDGWREQEPPPPDPQVYKTMAWGAVLGALAGVAVGGYTQLGYQSLPIQEAAGLQFGSLLLGFTGGATLLGPRLQPPMDPTTAAAMAGVAGLGFTLVTSTLAVAMGTGAAVVGGAVVGAALGFTGGLIRFDEKPKKG